MLHQRMRAASGPLSVLASSSGTSFTMESLFTAAQWTSNATKRVIVPNGVHLGSSNTSAALTIGATAWGGDLILEVQSGGIISGSGGAAGTSGAGGVGRNAFDANRLGASSQKVIVNVLSGGTIRGGGGGGGKGGAGGAGGTGGAGSVSNTPVYGGNDFWQDYYTSSTTIRWGAVYIYVGGFTTSYTSGGYTYTKGPLVTSASGYYYYRVTRTQYTSGGAGGGGGGGGNGGRGAGYDGASASGASGASGSAGSAGGTNAGSGGTGGTGGTGGAGGSYGASGSSGSTGATGATGNAGNAGSGAAGSAGAAGSSFGLAGYYVANASNATITNAGTVQGR